MEIVVQPLRLARPSGLTILTPTPTKAVSLLQDSEKIRVATGASAVEKQEKWSTFIVGPILKRHDGFERPVDITPDKVREELSGSIDKDTLKLVAWTKNSADPHLIEGYARVCVASTQASRFPMRLRLFGRPVNVSRVKNKPTVPQCTRCYGFHHERNCAKPSRCEDCGGLKHDGSPCEQPARCLNCRGAHRSSNLLCPARPRIVEGRVVRLSKSRLQSIRQVEGKAYADKRALEKKDTNDIQAQATQQRPVASGGSSGVGTAKESASESPQPDSDDDLGDEDMANAERTTSKPNSA